MKTPRKTVVAASVLALVASLLLAGGCGTVFESNQAACRRAINRTLSCLSTLVDVPLGTSFGASQGCVGVPETSECDDWRALADCVTSVSCDQFLFDPQVTQRCNEILNRLVANGCGAPGI